MWRKFPFKLLFNKLAALTLFLFLNKKKIEKRNNKNNIINIIIILENINKIYLFVQ